jgi:hypothetical protein
MTPDNEKTMTVQIVPLQTGGYGVALFLRADAFITTYDGTPEGNPHPGVTLLPAEARLVARRLVELADRIESGDVRRR